MCSNNSENLTINCKKNYHYFLFFDFFQKCYHFIHIFITTFIIIKMIKKRYSHFLLLHIETTFLINLIRPLHFAIGSFFMGAYRTPRDFNAQDSQDTSHVSTSHPRKIKRQGEAGAEIHSAHGDGSPPISRLRMTVYHGKSGCFSVQNSTEATRWKFHEIIVENAHKLSNRLSSTTTFIFYQYLLLSYLLLLFAAFN